MPPVFNFLGMYVVALMCSPRFQYAPAIVCHRYNGDSSAYLAGCRAMKRGIYAQRRGSAAPTLVRPSCMGYATHARPPSLSGQRTFRGRIMATHFTPRFTGKKGAAQAVYIAMEDPHTYLLLRALQSLVHRFRVSVAFKARLALHM